MPARVGERGETGYFASSIVGWYSQPDLKVSQVERQTGNGAFPVPERDVLYAARTVTLGVSMRASSRDAMVALVDGLLALEGQLVTMEVQDGTLATLATGYVRAAVGDGMHARASSATVTVVCPDPRRYGTAPSVGSMAVAPSSGAGGLTYDGGKLHWPLSWGAQAPTANVCTVHNGGTSTAYPTITVSGSMPGGFVLTDLSSGGQLEYAHPVTWQGVTLDCLGRTASVAGVDVTRHLTSRRFPSVAAGGSMTLCVQAAGTGAVAVEVRDTYI